MGATRYTKYIGGLQYNDGEAMSLGSTAYGICNDGASTAAKTVDIPGFYIETGATVYVKFNSGNTASSPTLNVGGTGARTIKGNTEWNAGEIVSCTFDGTSWFLSGNGTGSGSGSEITDYAVSKVLTNENLDDVKEPGFYNASGGNTCTNTVYAQNAFGLLVIHTASGEYYVQYWYNYTSGAVFKRNKNGTSWSSWTAIAETDYKVRQSAATGDTWKKVLLTATNSGTTSGVNGGVAAESTEGTYYCQSVDVNTSTGALSAKGLYQDGNKVIDVGHAKWNPDVRLFLSNSTGDKSFCQLAPDMSHYLSYEGETSYLANYFWRYAESADGSGQITNTTRLGSIGYKFAGKNGAGVYNDSDNYLFLSTGNLEGVQNGNGDRPAIKIAQGSPASSSSSIYAGTITFSAPELVPNITGVIDLGTNSLRWRNLYLSDSVYATNVYQDGTKVSVEGHTHSASDITGLTVTGDNDKVKQSKSTSNNRSKLLMTSASTSTAGGSITDNQVSFAYYGLGIEAIPNKGELYATKVFSGGTECEVKGHTHSEYLPLAGGNMTGANPISIPTQGSAYTQKSIVWKRSSDNKVISCMGSSNGTVGSESDAVLGIYSLGKIGLRPGTVDSVSGINVETEKMYPTTTNTISLGTSTNKFKSSYVTSSANIGSCTQTYNSAVDGLEFTFN